MASQGPGRKRTPSRNGVTPEQDALNVIAKEVFTYLFIHLCIYLNTYNRLLYCLDCFCGYPEP